MKEFLVGKLKFLSNTDFMNRKCSPRNHGSRYVKWIKKKQQEQNLQQELVLQSNRAFRRFSHVPCCFLSSWSCRNVLVNITFPLTLRKGALRCFESLPPSSIGGWIKLSAQFVHFVTSKDCLKLHTCLKNELGNKLAEVRFYLITQPILLISSHDILVQVNTIHDNLY